MIIDEIELEVAAKLAYEGARLLCRAFGHPELPSWEDSTEEARDSVRNGVEGVMRGNTPEKSHENWTAVRKSEGWTYGHTKNVATKEHPNLVPYNELPPEQQAKDVLFVNIVHAVSLAFATGAHVAGVQFEGTSR